MLRKEVKSKVFPAYFTDMKMRITAAIHGMLKFPRVGKLSEVVNKIKLGTLQG